MIIATASSDNYCYSFLHMSFYATILAYRRLAFLLIGLLFAHVLAWAAAVAAIIRYQQFWAIAGILWLPLIMLGLRWTAGALKQIYSARDDDVLQVNGVNVSGASDHLTGERLANVAEEIALATGEAQPDVAVCESAGLNAFIAYPQKQGRKQTAVVFTSAMASGLNRHELQAVAAHLYAHRRDFERMFVTMAGAMYVAVFAAADLFLTLNVLNWNFGGSGDFSTGPLVVVLVLGMLAGPILAAALAQAHVMRRARLAADLEAVIITHDPQSLLSALEKFSGRTARLEASYRMSNAHFYFDTVRDPARKFPWQKPATHPRPEARIKALKSATGL